MKVEIFSGNEGMVEILLNDWFSANPDIIIFTILQSESGEHSNHRSFTISVFYRLKTNE